MSHLNPNPPSRREMRFLIRLGTCYPDWLGYKTQTATTSDPSKQSERRRDIYVLVPSRPEPASPPRISCRPPRQSAWPGPAEPPGWRPCRPPCCSYSLMPSLSWANRMINTVEWPRTGTWSSVHDRYHNNHLLTLRLLHPKVKPVRWSLQVLKMRVEIIRFLIPVNQWKLVRVRHRLLTVLIHQQHEKPQQVSE